MANVYYEKDADRSIIAGRKVAVIGYGSQGPPPPLKPQEAGVGVPGGLELDRQGRGRRAPGALRR